MSTATAVALDLLMTEIPISAPLVFRPFSIPNAYLKLVVEHWMRLLSENQCRALSELEHIILAFYEMDLLAWDSRSCSDFCQILHKFRGQAETLSLSSEVSYVDHDLAMGLILTSNFLYLYKLHAVKQYAKCIDLWKIARITDRADSNDFILHLSNSKQKDLRLQCENKRMVIWRLRDLCRQKTGKPLTLQLVDCWALSIAPSSHGLLLEAFFRLQCSSNYIVPIDVLTICENMIWKQHSFLLTRKQLKWLSDTKHMEKLSDAVRFGNIRVQRGILKLHMFDDFHTIGCVHRMKKNLGVLFTVDEIQAVRDEIRGEHNTKAKTEEVDIDVLKLNDAEFVERMIEDCERGVMFIKHRKRASRRETRYVVIYGNRLYWKAKQEDKNAKSRSMSLSKVLAVLQGKQTKALKQESINDIPAECCFAIVSKKCTLDLSAPTLNPLYSRRFIAYLNAFRKHSTGTFQQI